MVDCGVAVHLDWSAGSSIQTQLGLAVMHCMYNVSDPFFSYTRDKKYQLLKKLIGVFSQ